MSVMPRYALLVGALAATLAGCGTASSPTAGGSGGPSARASSAHQAGGGAARPGGDLTVTVRAKSGATAVRWILRCDPPGGTVPNPASACADLLRMRPFAPRPIRMACPMIMAGSGRIVVSGTWYGQSVHRILVDGGCDFGQYGAFNKIFR